jgi:hypothetical protein
MQPTTPRTAAGHPARKRFIAGNLVVVVELVINARA